MKLLLKKILPTWFINLILDSVIKLNLLLYPFLRNSRFLASIYYVFFSRQFGREHQSVLAGKVAYQKSLKKIGESSALLRRNIHRLEKGLIMQPRRDVFAEGFIGETVNVYHAAVVSGGLNQDEKKWATDVLVEYFNVVGNTEIISAAKEKFNRKVLPLDEGSKFIPYTYDSLAKSDIQFDDLQKLFVKRRSVRWYQNKEVPMGLIEKAVSLSTLAPSACNRQPYFFCVSQNKEMAVKIAKCAGGTPGWSDNIPCTIAIIGDLSAYPSERDRHVIYIDGSLAAMQLMLALETLGLSTCSINWPDIESTERKMEKLLDLKAYERPIMLLSVGFAQDKGGIPYSQKKNAQLLIKKV